MEELAAGRRLYGSPLSWPRRVLHALQGKGKNVPVEGDRHGVVFLATKGRADDPHGNGIARVDVDTGAITVAHRASRAPLDVPRGVPPPDALRAAALQRDRPGRFGAVWP
ncbi:hypothetical protein WME90_04535 [Sorangium sp. So ce375]|uniref:hypothetical protein n=1 Tax=Sorangium sp. So ce375 TaxID=3133306 RepID=UPI003F5B4CDF